MTGSRPPIGRLSPDNWASHGAGRHWLRGHTPHFLHEKCAVSTESQLLKIVRRPQACLPSHGCDTAVGVRSTDSIQLGALELLLKAAGRDLILKVMISRFLRDHVGFWSCCLAEAGAITFKGSQRATGGNGRWTGSTPTWHTNISTKSTISTLREAKSVAAKVRTILIHKARLIRIGFLALHLTESTGQCHLCVGRLAAVDSEVSAARTFQKQCKSAKSKKHCAHSTHCTR